MTVDFTVTDARPEDVDEISEIENASFSDTWSKRLIELEILNDSAVFIVARDEDGMMLGYAGGRQVFDEFNVTNIAVREECRGLGIGSALLQQLIDTACDQGSAFVTLEVRVSNQPARKMYESFGFIPLGERRDYYQNPQENAMIYTLYLNFPEAADEDFGN